MQEASFKLSYVSLLVVPQSFCYITGTSPLAASLVSSPIPYQTFVFMERGRFEVIEPSDTNTASYS